MRGNSEVNELTEAAIYSRKHPLRQLQRKIHTCFCRSRVRAHHEPSIRRQGVQPPKLPWRPDQHNPPRPPRGRPWSHRPKSQGTQQQIFRFYNVWLSNSGGVPKDDWNHPRLYQRVWEVLPHSLHPGKPQENPPRAILDGSSKPWMGKGHGELPFRYLDRRCEIWR